MNIRYLLIFTPISMAAIGQILLKSGMNKIGEITFSGQLPSSFLKIFTNPLVLVGLFFYGGGMLLWLIVLSKEELSFVYPMVAASYVITVVLSRIFLKEEVPMLRWFALLIIVVGILLITKTSK